MKKNFVIVVFLSCLITISCNKNNSTNNKSEGKIENYSENETTESELKKEDFPIEDLKINFKHYKEYGNIDGPSMEMSFILKNNTANKITNFKFQYYIKAIFDNGEEMYFPNTLLKKQNNGQDVTHDDELLLNNSSLLLSTLEINEIWQPQTTKELNYVVGQYMPKGNFIKEIFNRTPQSLSVVYRYNAISIDQEYNYFGNYDILEHWKKYQTEIGLR